MPAAGSHQGCSQAPPKSFSIPQPCSSPSPALCSQTRSRYPALQTPGRIRSSGKSPPTQPGRLGACPKPGSTKSVSLCPKTPRHTAVPGTDTSPFHAHQPARHVSPSLGFCISAPHRMFLPSHVDSHFALLTLSFYPPHPTLLQPHLKAMIPLKMRPDTSTGKAQLMGLDFTPPGANHKETLCKAVVLLPYTTAESACFITCVILLILQPSHLQRSLQTPQALQ